MKPYGSKRTYAKCTVLKVKAGRARKIKVTVKNHKHERGNKNGFTPNL